MTELDLRKLKSIIAVVNEQAEDYGLWFEAVYATEAYLQQELRRLHSVIEAADLERLLADLARLARTL